jgi:hypothetical protein
VLPLLTILLLAVVVVAGLLEAVVVLAGLELVLG